MSTQPLEKKFFLFSPLNQAMFHRDQKTSHATSMISASFWRQNYNYPCCKHELFSGLLLQEAFYGISDRKGAPKGAFLESERSVFRQVLGFCPVLTDATE